jgi:ADP-heptose:LPS heptosyltransferase
MMHLKQPTEIIQSASDATNFDVWLPIMSIPQRLGLTNDDMLLDDPYLIVEPKRIEGTKKKIGICWAGSNNHQYNRYRTIFEKDYDLLRNLIKKNDRFEWYSLIKDEYEDDHDKLGISNPVKNFKNVHETAEFIKGLDLVISIDTLQAHLAGAMKVPTILMLPWFPEWRWGLEGDSTIWYPSVHIIRQEKAFDWKSVLDRVDERLKAL